MLAGLKHCKVNVHLLGHLSHYVKLFGPLWTHSAFAFEDAIGGLVKKSHGTHDIANQVCSNVKTILVKINEEELP